MNCFNHNYSYDSKERCSSCDKYIYLHDIALIYALDNKAYHSNCLKISNTCAYELLDQKDWFCPSSSRQLLPFYDYEVQQDIIQHKLIYCVCCFKPISRLNHIAVCCSKCTMVMHKTCQRDNLCDKCFVETAESNNPQNHCGGTRSFEPFQYISQNYNDKLHDPDSSDNDTTVISNAQMVLDNCKMLSIDAYVSEISHLHDSKHTSIFFLNINGFKTNFYEFLATKINLCETPFDFYCFCETNVKEDEPNDFHIDGFRNTNLFAARNKDKGSGLSIYYRSHLDFMPNNHFTVRNNMFEALGGILITPLGKIQILCIYRFHYSNKNKFCELFFNFLQPSAEKPTIICGDFNIDLFDSNTCDSTSEFCDTFISKGFIPLINKTTRVSKNTSTCIDHFWTNITENRAYSAVLDSSISDQFPITAVLPSPSVTFDSNPTSESVNLVKHVAVISENAVSDFAKDLSMLAAKPPSDGVIYDADITRANFTCFSNTFNEIYQRNFIKVKSSASSACRNATTKPYITLALSKSCKVKNRLHNNWIRVRGTQHEHAAKEAYKSYRTTLKKLILQSKANYYLKKFDENRGNLRACWKVNDIRHKNRNITLPNYVNINQSNIRDRRSIMQSFNEHFTSVASTLNNNKYNSVYAVPDFREYLKNRSENSMIAFTSVGCKEIFDIVNKFNPNKASDTSVRILKLHINILLPKLTLLMNDCIQSGYFPDELKIAKVLPLYKSGDVNGLNNYRPISILPLLSKILEKLIYSRLLDSFTDNNIIIPQQFGFRENHSTTHALHMAITRVCKAINNKNVR